MPTYRPGPQFYTSSPLGGSRVHKPVGSGVDWSQWFDHFWQAKGAASYVASLLDLVDAQTLVEGNGGVPWAAGTGWGFVAAFAQWLDTGLIPVLNPRNWTILMQYTAAISVNARIWWGILDTVGHDGGLFSQIVIPNGMRTAHGTTASSTDNAGLVLAGNYGLSALQPYRNGIAEPNSIAGANGTTDLSIYIGGLNLNGAAVNFPTFNCTAFGIKKGPALTAPQVAAAALAMSLL